MIGRTWADQFATRIVARALVLSALPKHTPTSIIETGLRVTALLANFRRDHHVPERTMVGGLLSTGPLVVPFNDWELARHLQLTSHKSMKELTRQFAGDSPLLALAAIAASCDEAPGWLHEALPELAHMSNAAQEVRVRKLGDAINSLQPLADHGERFTARKPGSLSPIAKKIKAYMGKHPTAKAIEVWAALKKSPPKGYLFRDTEKFGRYIERGADTVMKWPRFGNLVSEHRPKK